MLKTGRGQHRKYLPLALTERNEASRAGLEPACEPRDDRLLQPRHAAGHLDTDVICLAQFVE
jgi:hypothetical protein